MKNKMISALLSLAMILSLLPVSAFAADYGPWSDWSTTYPGQAVGRKIDTREVTVGYNMVTYLTMTYEGVRQYRSYSVGGNYSAYGLRPQYGEHHYDYYASKEAIDAADTCGEGVYVNYASNTAGYNMGSGTAYCGWGVQDCLIWFVDNTVTQREYRYCDLQPNEKVYPVEFFDWDGTSLKFQVVTEGGSATPPPTPSRAGYIFAGWDKPYTNITHGTNITALYTKEAVPTILVFFDANGGIISFGSTEVTYGGQYGALPTATRSGYTFDGWYTAAEGGSRITDSSTVSMRENHTLYAHWTENVAAYTVFFDANGGTVSESSRRVVNGETFGQLPVPSRNGYTFAGWYTASAGGSRVAASNVVSLAGDQTLYARWTKETVSFTIFFDANGGSVSSSEKAVTSGDTYGELPSPVRDGYTFDGWYTSASGGVRITATDIVDLTTNQTLYAHWTRKAITYTISFNANGGSVSTSAKSVTNGSAYGELPVPIREGYSFDGWYTAAEGGRKFSAGDTVSLTGNQTLYAHWAKKDVPFIVLFNANGGSVSTSSKTVKVGESYGELPTPTRSGYTFDGWYTAAEGGSLVSSTTKVALAENQTLYAHWTKQERDIFNPLEEGYSFSNSREALGLSNNYVIPLDLWISVYGDRLGKSMYDQHAKPWGGSCFGFSVTSTKFYNGNLSASSYGGSDTYFIPAPKYSASPITRLINAAQISWWLPGVADVDFSLSNLLAACDNFAENGTNPVILYIDGYAGNYDYCHAVVPWKVERIDSEVRIYVYDNNHPGNESLYYTVHANGAFTCNYTYASKQITIQRLGFQYLQQVLDGERKVSSMLTPAAGMMLISIDSGTAEIKSANGTPIDQINGAQRIEQMPTDGISEAEYVEYWVPQGDYQIVTHDSEIVSVLVADESETYRLSLSPRGTGVTVDVGSSVEVANVMHGNVTSYMSDGRTQTLPATSLMGAVTVPGSEDELASFSDVSSANWYNDAISSISTAGIVNGVGNGRYDPQGKLTVGMLVTILMRTQYGSLDSNGAWYAAYMDRAMQDQVLFERDGLTPESEITRAQAALLLTRYVERYNPRWAKVRTASSPADMSNVPAQYRDAVAKAYAWDLLHGDAEGRFNPANTLTRAEAVQMIYNYYSTVD